MAILVDENSRVLIQGITGSVGQRYAKRMLDHGTPLVAGVTPGKGGQSVFGVPVYDSVEEAVKSKDVNISLIVVPPIFVKQAVLEAIDAGIKTIVIYAEGVPVHDSMKIVQYARLNGAYVLGPNSAGAVSPGKANVSDLNDSNLIPGSVGIVSRSGTLTYEANEILKSIGVGVSTVVCLGGDPIIATQHYQILELFEHDQDTEAVVYIGEIGGNDEVLASEYIRKMTKPVFAYIGGRYAPKNKRMGHAGAIIRNENESAIKKQELLKENGAKVVNVITELEEVLKSHFHKTNHKTTLEV